MLMAKTGNKQKVKGQGSLQEHVQNYNQRADMLVESWNRTRVGVKLDRLKLKLCFPQDLKMFLESFVLVLLNLIVMNFVMNGN